MSDPLGAVTVMSGRRAHLLPLNQRTRPTELGSVGERPIHRDFLCTPCRRRAHSGAWKVPRETTAAGGTQAHGSCSPQSGTAARAPPGPSGGHRARAPRLGGTRHGEGGAADRKPGDRAMDRWPHRSGSRRIDGLTATRGRGRRRPHTPRPARAHHACVRSSWGRRSSGHGG